MLRFACLSALLLALLNLLSASATRRDPPVSTYYNLRGKKISLPGENYSKKFIVLTSSENPAIIEKMIRRHMVIALPTNAILDSMTLAFDRSLDAGTEFLFLVGKNDSVSYITQGTDTEVVAGPEVRSDLAENKHDIPAYTVHVHERYPRSGVNSDPDPSPEDRHPANFRDRTMASVVLGYYEQDDPMITFYYLNYTEKLTFSDFKRLVKKISSAP